jgi:hypothetical protein
MLQARGTGIGKEDDFEVKYEIIYNIRVFFGGYFHFFVLKNAFFLQQTVHSVQKSY